MSKKPQTEKIEKEVWRNRIVGRAEVLASELIPHPANWRTHPEAQRVALAAVLGEVGWVQDVVVNKRTGRVLDGHLRRDMAAEKGERVPVVYVDLSEAEERLILATFDPLSALAVPDDAKLKELLAEIETSNHDLAAFFEELVPDADVSAPGLTEDDAVPEAPGQPVTTLGDLWLLGAHRLLCGDSTSLDAVEKLMDGQKADMVFTDPPYGVNFGEANHNPRAKRWEKIKNDDRKGSDLGEFLRACFANIICVAREACPAYIWSASMAAGYDMLKAQVDAGLHIQSQIIWVKNCIVLGQADYQWRHEPCWYGWTPGKHHFWAGGRALSTVWEFSKDANQSYQHPAQKPTALAEHAIGNSCARGGAVLDLFGGSGSTLVACEKTERRAHLMEMHTGYCDVIVKRWQAFTGKEATLASDGRTFAQIASERINSEDSVCAVAVNLG